MGLILSIPLWVLFCSTAVLVLVSWELGFRLGKVFVNQHRPVKVQAISSTVAAILGLVGFLFGFTFNMASSAFLERRKVLISEVNAIETTYLRTRMIAEPESSDIRRLLREYVDIRVSAEMQTQAGPEMERSRQIRDQLWESTVAATAKNRDAIMAQFLASMNQLIDAETERTTLIFQHRIPDTIWLSLFGLTVLVIAAIGYQGGLNQGERSPTLLVVAFTFALVVIMIADLDSPGKGALRVDQQAMINLQYSLNNGL
jgi:hypothetical protein